MFFLISRALPFNIHFRILYLVLPFKTYKEGLETQCYFHCYQDTKLYHYTLIQVQFTFMAIFGSCGSNAPPLHMYASTLAARICISDVLSLYRRLINRFGNGSPLCVAEKKKAIHTTWLSINVSH